MRDVEIEHDLRVVMTAAQWEAWKAEVRDLVVEGTMEVILVPDGLSPEQATAYIAAARGPSTTTTVGG